MGLGRGMRRPCSRRACHSLIQRGLGTHTPSRAFPRANRNRMVGRVIFPMEGESAAPDMATAVGKLRPFELMIDSYDDVPTMPTEGPPMYSEVKKKLAAARPGGVAPSSETLAAAHTMSSGPDRAPLSDSFINSSSGISRATISFGSASL